MPNPFLDSFNAGLSDIQAQTGEMWHHVASNKDWPSISIDRDSTTSQAMSGGTYVEVHTLIFITEQVFLDSGIKKGDILTTERGSFRFQVEEIDDDGDAARTLLCGPVQVKLR